MPPAPPPLPLRLCPKHGIVAGRDGKCVICHRNDVESAGAGYNRRFLAGLLLPVVLIGGMLIWKVTSSARRPPDVIRDDSPARARGSAAPAAARAETEEGASPRTDEEIRAAIQIKEERARQQRIEEEMSKVRVRMFVINTCEMCDAARAWLAKEGLSSSEVNVDDGPDALAELRKLTPSTQVPVFDVEGEVLVGFAPTTVLGAVRRAADKHTRFLR